METRRVFSGRALREIYENRRPNAHKRRLSQEELAKLAGYSRTVVGRAVVSNQCSDKVAKAFAKVLGVDIEEFYREDTVEQFETLCREERHVIEAMRSNDDAREWIIRQAEAYVAASQHLARRAGEQNAKS